jgi:hypothetical protein
LSETNDKTKKGKIIITINSLQEALLKTIFYFVIKSHNKDVSIVDDSVNSYGQ